MLWTVIATIQRYRTEYDILFRYIWLTPPQVASRFLRTIVVGPADPAEDPGGKLAAVIARLKEPVEDVTSKAFADASAGGGSGELGSGLVLQSHLSAAEEESAHAGHLGEEEARKLRQREADLAAYELQTGKVALAKASSDASADDRREPGQPQQPVSISAVAKTSPSSAAESHTSSPSGSSSRDRLSLQTLSQQQQSQQELSAPFLQSHNAQQNQQTPILPQLLQQPDHSPTVRELLARSRVNLAKAMDAHPEPPQRDSALAERQPPRTPLEEHQRAQSMSVEETLDASRRRLSAATEGGEGHP